MKHITVSLIIVLLLTFIGCISGTTVDLPSNPTSQITPQSPTVKSLPPEIQAEPTPVFPMTITDDLGRIITIKKLPLRIVSLAPSNTEILFALDLESRIVGVTDYCDYPEGAKMKPRVAGYSTPNMEKLASIEPDIIFAESIHEKTVLPALEKLGFTVVVFSAATIESVFNNITLIGKITGKSLKAASLTKDLTAKTEEIRTKTKNLDFNSRPRLLFVVWHQPVWTMGSKTFIDDLFKAAGANNIYSSEFEKSRIVSLESIIASNPQVIIVTGMATSGDQIYDGIKNESRLRVIDAIKNNRIYKISDSNIVERPGPRITEGLLELAKLIHPEIFGAIK